tara:strand:+ start:16023 stop:16427 length:405 start_codon:yes stop_codon:yes gene_type:complete
MKKPKPHWEDLPSDEMYELISDVAKLFCWYLFFEKGMPREKDDPRDLGWDWARNNALHQPDRFYDLFITCAMDCPIPLKKCERIVDLLEISVEDVGNIRTAVEMALEWFDCEIREEPVMDKNEGILDMVKVKQK